MGKLDTTIPTDNQLFSKLSEKVPHPYNREEPRPVVGILQNLPQKGAFRLEVSFSRIANLSVSGYGIYP